MGIFPVLQPKITADLLREPPSSTPSYSMTPLASLLGASQQRLLLYYNSTRKDQSRDHASQARQLAALVDAPMRAKLSWFQARLSSGSARFDHLKAAQEDLAVSRPADCLLVTLELIEMYLYCDDLDGAAQEIPRLCDLVEVASEDRHVQDAISRLVRPSTSMNCPADPGPDIGLGDAAWLRALVGRLGERPRRARRRGPA